MSGASRRAAAVSLRLERVTYGDGTVALRDVALSVAPGEIVGVVGHVGAGKTTLALAAAGLLGRSVPARIDGRLDRAAASGGAAAAAYVFANPWTQLTELGDTVEEEVAVGPENLAVSPPLIGPRVERALALADASHLARRAPAELSGGELQRVALAAALALEAPLLVLDEPTAQLDPEAARGFADRLRALAARGVAVLLVEQNLELAAELADRVLVLADGRVLAQGEPRALLGRRPPLDPRLGALAEPADAWPRASPARTAAEPLLEIRGLRAGYEGHSVLDDLSLAVPRGRAVAWLGRNGAGKSTLARAVVGLVPASAGTVRVGDVLLDGLPVERRARSVGLVFQDPQRQLFSRTVLEEASFAPRAMGLGAAASRARARDALEVVGLAACEQAHPGDLAPQSQRLLGIAAAMSAAPPLLILDEPTAGQDAAGRAVSARAVARQRERGAAVVITHDLRFAREACDEAMVLEKGRIVDRA